MKIGICANVTPDTDARVKPNSDGSGVEVSGKKVVGPYDLLAVEEAIRTKEAVGGEVIAITVGGGKEVVERLRQSALAPGADKAIFIHDEALKNADSLGVARALAKVIESEGIELVFCGKQAIDNDNVQVPSMIAEILGWAQVSRAVEFSVDGGTFTATRAMDGGIKEVVSGSLPAVITADRGLNTPRFAKLPQILKAKRKPQETKSLADIGLTADEVSPKLSTTAFTTPPERPKGKIIEGDAATAAKELVRLLREEAKVI